MNEHDREEKLLRSVVLQNAQAVLLARERAERSLIAAKEELERKSEELAEQRESFRVTLSSIGDGVITTGIDGKIAFFNPVAEAMTGWESGDAIGQPVEAVFNIIDEHSEELAPNPVREVLRKGIVAKIADRTVLIARDGRKIPLADSAAPIRDVSGNISGAVMVFHDVTSQREAERTLRESNKRATDILESITDAFVVLDKEWSFTYLNPRAARVLGPASKSQTNLVGKNYWEEFPDLVDTPLEKNFRSVTQERQKVEFEIFYAPLQAWFEIRAYPTREGLSFYFLNITDRKRAVETRQVAEEQLRRSEEELRANENLRKLSASLLQARDDEQRRLARELHDSVGQLLVAIGINIGNIEREAHKLSTEAAEGVFDTAALIQQVNREIRTISHLLHPPLLDEAGLHLALQWYVEGFADRSKVKVDLEMPSDFGRLPNDTEIAIFRIIQECLTNIHRHSGSPTAVISIHRETRRLIVRVQDSGKGIPKERQREIESGRGGVGFSGMRERVRQLGGTLEIHSEGSGTTVRVVLDIVEKAIPRADELIGD